MHLGAGTLEKMSIGLGTKDLTTIEGIVGAMAKLVGLTEKYSQLSNKKLQLKAFDGTLTREQFDQHKGNINALKAMNKGFAQGQAHLDAEAQKMAKEGIKLVEQHTRKLKEQAVEKNKIARRDAAEAVNTRATLKRKASEGSLTRADIKNARTPEELKAIQSGITDRYHNPKLTNPQRQVLSGLEDMVQKRLVKANITPFEKQSQLKFSKLDDFKNLQADQKGESKVGLSLLARRIATLKKEGGSYAQVVQMEALHQAARDIHAEKFRPSSAFQLREKENQRVANLPQNMPLANLSSLTSRDEVARQLRMSSIRAKEMSEGPAKQAEILYANALKAHGATLVKVAKTQDKISKSFIAEMQSKAEKGLFTRHDSRQITDLAQVGPLRKSLSQAVDDKTLTQSQRLVAAQARHELRLREIALKDALKVIDPVARASGLNRDAKNAAIQSDPKHYNTAIESGTRSIEQKTRQLNKAKELERVAASQYLTTQSLNGLSAEELTHAKKIINYRKNMAGANQQQADVELKLLSHIRSIEQATAEQARAAKKLAIHNQRMATDAGYRLAQDQKDLVRWTESHRRQLQETASDRLVAKAVNEARYEQSRQNGTYATPQAIAALHPDQFREARNTLNYSTKIGSQANQDNAAKMLKLLAEREALEKKSIVNNSLIAELAKTHYKTAAEINTLGRSELEMAKQVLAFRIRNAATQTEAWHQQQLLNQVNTNSSLQNKAAHRLNPEYQAENRAGSRERILGDAGASVLTIQAGLMLNYKLLAGMQGLFGNALSSVIELDSAFRQLQAISASTNTEMVSMKQNLILVAQASMFSAAEVGNTAVLLAQAGFSIGEISQSMKGVIALAQATGTELGKSVDVVTSVLSVFNKGAGETDQVVNQLTEALNRSKLDINKMALGIQYAGNIASDSGVSFEDLTSALGAMANAGIRSGSTLGTGLRQMFIDLQKPSEKLKARLDGLGLSLDQVDLHSNGLVGVLENLRNAGFTSADAFQTFEVRAASAFAALSGNIGDFNELKDSLNDTNAAFEANGVQLEALAVQLDHLKSNLGILSAEALKPVATLVRDLSKATAHMMEKTEEGSGALMAFGTVLSGLGVAVAVGWLAKLSFELGSMVWGLTKVRSGLMAARAAMAAHAAGTAVLTGATLAATTAAASLRVALAAAAPILIGLVAGVGLVVAAYRSYANETEKLNEKLDQAKAAFNKAKEGAATAKTAYESVSEAINDLSDKYGVLQHNQAATTDEAQSLVTKFGEMGFAIDDVANSKVENLMAKLRELRKELGQEYRSASAKSFAAEASKLIASDTSDENLLAGKEFSPRTLSQKREGLLYPTGRFTGNRDVRSMEERLMATRARSIRYPAMTDFLAKLAGDLKDVQKANGLPKGFNIPELERLFSNLKLNAPIGVDAYQLNRGEEIFTELMKGAEARQRIDKSPENKRKIANRAYRDAALSTVADESHEKGKAVNSAQTAQLEYAAEAARINKVKGLTNEQKVRSKFSFAEKIDKRVKAEVAMVDKLLEPLRVQQKALEDSGDVKKPAYVKVSTDIEGLERQKQEMLTRNAAVDEALRQGKALKGKGELQDLQRQLEARNEELKDLKREDAGETGLLAHNTKAQQIRNKKLEVDKLSKAILLLQVKEGADTEGQLLSLAQKVAIEKKYLERELAEKGQAIALAAQKAQTNAAKDRKEEALDDFAQAQQDWVEAYNLNNDLFDQAQAAARKRANSQYKKVLNAGNMFKDINKELRDAAQEAANATGQAQEYSNYGTGIGGFFARQAANAKNGVNEGKLKQEKLARDFIQLKGVEDHFIKQKGNYDIPAAQAAIEAQHKALVALDAKLGDVNLSGKAEMEDNKAKLVTEIGIAEKELKLQQDLVKWHGEERQRLLASIERLTEDLAAMQVEANTLMDAFNSGRQALDAGLSTIFGDWATQTIKNIDDVEAAFKSMGISILQSMLKVVSDRTAMAFTNMLLGKADGSTGLGLVGQLGSAIFGGFSNSTVPKGMTDFSSGINVAGYASTGGFPKGNAMQHFATGGSVSGTNLGHDTIPAMLMPNEYILKPSATSALGKPFLDRLNATTTGSLKQLEGKAQAPQINVVQSPPTNVYVVSPDQKQQMGANDVVVVIEDNISRNGSIKQLIKQVVSGEA
jgi:TP901 family phage tail tape measure protein